MAHLQDLRDPLYQNWIKVGLALKYGRDIVSEFISRSVTKFKIETLRENEEHNCTECTIFNILPCPTASFCRIDRGNCLKHDTTDTTRTHRPCPAAVCDTLYSAIKSQYTSGGRGPAWSQTDSQKWCSNVWEIAKCFMPSGYENKHDITEYDFSGTMSLIINCKFIQYDNAQLYDMQFFQKLRDIRNKVMHSGRYHLTQDELTNCIQLLTTMANRVLGSRESMTFTEQQIYDDIIKLDNSRFCVIASDELKVMQETQAAMEIALHRLRFTTTENKQEAAEQLQSQREEMVKLKEHIRTLILKVSELECPIPTNIREQHQTEISRWVMEDKDFVDTRASQHITTNLETNCRCVLVVGSPASGKTTLTRHTALRLQKEEGLQIVPIYEASEIRNFYNGSQSQVFVFDDCFGSIHLDDTLVNKWNHYMKQIKNIITSCQQTKHILLMSSRRYIYEDVPKASKEGLHAEITDLTCKELLLNDTEKHNLLTMYLRDHFYCHSWFCFSHPYFPLLCKIARARNLHFDETLRLFKNPVEVMKREIEIIRDSSGIKFCCLCLLTFFKDDFKKQWLVDSNSFSVEIHTPLSSILKGFKLKLKYEIDKISVLESFKSLEQSYISYSNGKWSFIHNSIYESCIKLCGEYLFDTFLEHVDPSFISVSYLLQIIKLDEMSDNKYMVDRCILVPPEKESMYFSRIKSDIQTFGLSCIFSNKQFIFQTFRHQIKQIFKRDPSITKFISECLYKNDLSCVCRQHNLHHDTIDYAVVTLADIGSEQQTDTRKWNIWCCGKTLLLWACQRGDKIAINRFIHAGANIHTCDYDGRNVLMYACDVSRKQRIGILDEEITALFNLLLKHGADINACNKQGQTVLMLASKYGKDYCEHGANINSCDKKGTTGLILASKGRYSSYFRTVEFLVEHGAKINARDSQGKTALMWISSKPWGTTGNIVDFLVKHGANINTLDNQGKTALMWAVRTDVIDILIRNNAETNVCDIRSKSVLMYLCSIHGTSNNLIETLIASGIDINTTDIYGKTALMCAIVGNNFKLVELLVTNGAEVNARDKNGRTALMRAAGFGNYNIVDLLIQHGAEINARDNQGKTVLMWASAFSTYNCIHVHFRRKCNICKYRRPNVIKLLLLTGADIHLLDNEGKSLLLHFCSKRKPCEYLISLCLIMGSDIHEGDENGKTPLMWASEAGNRETVECLLTHGADVKLRDNQGKTALISASEKANNQCPTYGVAYCCHLG